MTNKFQSMTHTTDQARTDPLGYTQANQYLDNAYCLFFGTCCIGAISILAHFMFG